MKTPNVRRVLVAATCACLCALSACSKTGSTPAAASSVPTTAGVDVAGRLCAVLRSKTPELKGMSEVGARAQLVMAIGTAFDADARSLATVSADIDAIASTGCPEVRAPLLAATRAATLQEAVR